VLKVAVGVDHHLCDQARHPVVTDAPRKGLRRARCAMLSPPPTRRASA
jgi:hypothetical protein